MKFTKDSIDGYLSKLGLETNEEIEWTYTESINNAEEEKDKTYIERNQELEKLLKKFVIEFYDDFGNGLTSIGYIRKEFYDIESQNGYPDYVIKTISNLQKEVYIFDTYKEAKDFIDDNLYEIGLHYQDESVTDENLKIVQIEDIKF